jgi:hypothetical protein
MFIWFANQLSWKIEVFIKKTQRGLWVKEYENSKGRMPLVYLGYSGNARQNA